MKTTTGYDWKFANIGGATRVNLETGEDVVNLWQLDQKLWTVLSCPVTGLEFDAATLALMDADGDGKIRVPEVMDVARWLGSVLSDAEVLTRRQDEIPLSALNQENADGKKLYDTALNILKALGREKDSICLQDTADMLAGFAKHTLNGDGVIMAEHVSEAADKEAIEACQKTIGTVKDSSGADGVNADNIKAFYAACADYAAWKAAGEAGKETIFPYGDKTADALAAYKALKEKVEDFFVRCKLVAFDEAAAATLDMSAARLEAATGKILSAGSEEIAACPLARVSGKAELPLNGGINPAWEAAFANFKALIADVDLAGKKTMTEADWTAIGAKLAPYEAWMASKKGEAVEPLGIEAVQAFLKADRQDSLLGVSAQDQALATELDDIKLVDKLLHFVRDIFQFVRNYVSFQDFYSPDPEVKAVFQAGTLFVDQRSCDLCIRVSDMGKHGDMAGLSGMFLLYCDCTSKTKGTKMTIAAVLTEGSVETLRVGQNAIFYDRDGNDWDAVVTKIIDNPVSVKQAFFSPYKKLGRWITEKINKSAADKEANATGNLISSTDSISLPVADGDAKKADKQPFDIAKFAGIFAAIGMALGFLLDALVKLAQGAVSIGLWKDLLVLVAVMLCISGPSMFIAWSKLRKRNLAPVLNANGWAINAHAYVSILFGASLTKLAGFPMLKFIDPSTKKKLPAWAWILIVVVLLAAVFAVLYFCNLLGCIGLGRPCAAPEAVQAVEAVADSLTIVE